jgi:hypothetical protein
MYEKLKSYADKTAELLQLGCNSFFKENPQFTEAIRNAPWQRHVANVRSQIIKGLKYIESHKSLADINIGAFSFLWDDGCYDSFSLWLSSSNSYQEWMENDLGDFAVIDFTSVLNGFMKLDDRESALKDDLNHINNLMAALLETALLESLEEGDFQNCSCESPFIVTLAMWHDTEATLIYHSTGELSDEIWREVAHAPKLEEGVAEE